MKKRIGIITFIVAVALLVVALPLLAGPGMRGHGFGFGGHGGGHGLQILRHLDHVREKLDLTDAQVDQLKAIARQTHEENGTYHQQLKGGLHDIVTTLLADPNNTAQAQAILDRQAAAENAMKKNILAATSEALNVLTAEQRTKLAQLIGEHRARHDRR
ncbi:MAG TPA: Spy/CpxP family protein refolding chaperone [Thermoanaerobaculia bacterium]|jgi:Spy/CpxP family protein refolding chaperone